MIRILIILLFLFISRIANATGQIGDILLWKGDTLTLFSNPLELRADWNKLSSIIISELEKENRILYTEKYKTGEVESMNSTTCWRGYKAEWVIINDKLYLKNIYACHDNMVRADLKKIFGKELNSELLFANWVTDKLYVPQGECIEFVNLDYKSIYETETVIEFKKGVLAGSKTYHNYIARKSQFTSDTTDFLDFFYSQINWKELPDLKGKHILVAIGIQPNKDGKMDSLLNDYTYMLDSVSLITDRNNVFFREAIRVAELIPDWDVIVQRGQIVNRNIIIMFDEIRKKKYAKISPLVK